MKRFLVSALPLALLLAWPWLATATEPSFVDDSGQTIRIKAPFKRIISLYPAHTENLYALGLEGSIIGVSPGETQPPRAADKPVYSYRDDPERFLAARPDLVLIRPMVYRGHRALVDRLKQAGIAVVSLQPNNVEEMYAYWRRLGWLGGHAPQAEAMVQGFQQGLSAIQARWAGVPQEERPRVYFEAIHAKMKTFAPDSMGAFVLYSAGGVNVAQDAQAVRGTNIAAYGQERILAQGANIDVYLAQVGTMNKVSLEQINNASGFGAIKAVQTGRVYLVDEELVSRPTPRLLQGIEAMHRLLYPAGRAAPRETKP
ncbi:MAG: ABC transporter substrate-binding protein [Desulfarculus sp.]|nr:ABC transporter substrate-binding protein [Desulfarculus sp.]